MDKVELALWERIVRMQWGANTAAVPDWTERKFPFYRALWTEVGEAMGYVQWPWWKNVEGAQLVPTGTLLRHLFIELCDALHFGISCRLESRRDLAMDEKIARVAKRLAEDVDYAANRYQNTDIVVALENTAEYALAEHEFDATSFFAAVNAAGLGVHGLMAYYFAKNTLNCFRWDHGYREGKYVKNWGSPQHPMEDNQYLGDLVDNYLNTVKGDNLLRSLENGNFLNHLRLNLSNAYNEVLDARRS